MCFEADATVANGLCTACNTKLEARKTADRINKALERYNDWLGKIKKQPIQPLTEEQWMEACRYFEGCAYCGASEISARSMFIDYANGGRYCAWNIIPACERCETCVKRDINPFKRLDQRINRKAASQAKRYGFSLSKLQKIVDYLETKMEVK